MHGPIYVLYCDIQSDDCKHKATTVHVKQMLKTLLNVYISYDNVANVDIVNSRNKISVD